MRISVLISTYDRPDDVVECVQSLLGGFETPDEIIVVDDGDTARTRERLAEAELFDAVDHIDGPEKNLPASRNAGIEAASGDIICFVDDDTIVSPNWLQQIHATYERENDITGVGGHVVNYNPERINKANINSFGYRMLTAVRKLFLLDKIGVVSPVGILWAPHTFMTPAEQDVEALQGCNMSFRSDVFDEFRFNEWYGTTGSSACEELDFCSQVSANGDRLVYNPRAVVVHKRTLNDESRAGTPNYENITNLTYCLLNNPKLGVLNYILFVASILVFSLLKLDAKYLMTVFKGTKRFLISDRRLDTNSKTGE